MVSKQKYIEQSTHIINKRNTCTTFNYEHTPENYRIFLLIISQIYTHPLLEFCSFRFLFSFYHTDCCISCMRPKKMSRNSRDTQLYKSQGPIKKHLPGTRYSVGREPHGKPQQYSQDNLPHTRDVAPCSAGGRQACIAL